MLSARMKRPAPELFVACLTPAIVQQNEFARSHHDRPLQGDPRHHVLVVEERGVRLKVRVQIGVCAQPVYLDRDLHMQLP